MRGSALLAAGLAACSGPDEEKTPPDPPTPTSPPPTTSPPVGREVDCTDVAPPNAISSIVAVTVADGEEPPDCLWTCDPGFDRVGGACVAAAACARGWCFENPYPTSNPVHAGGFEDGAGAWIAANGTVFRELDGRWTEVPTDGIVTELWVAGRDDVWLFSSAFLHWDGARLVDHTPADPPLEIRAAGPWRDGDDWVVGSAFDGPAIWVRQGEDWTRAPLTGLGFSPLEGVARSGPGQGWVDDGRNVWFVDLDAGTATRLPDVPASDLVGRAVLDGLLVIADRSGTAWIWDGATWTDTGLALLDLWSAPEGSEVFGAAAGGVSRWDGAGWGDERLDFDPVSVFGTGDRAGASGWDGELALRDASGWTTVSSGIRTDWRSASAGGDDDIWACGPFSDAIGHWDGLGWTEVRVPGDFVQPQGVYAPGDRSVWVAADRLLHRRPDGDWESFPRWDRGGFQAVHGLGPDEVWAVDYGGRASRFTPGERFDTHSGLDSLGYVFVAGPDDVWAAHDAYGDLVHWDGTSWTPMGLDEPWVGLAGTGPDDVWAVTEDGELYHWDGTRLAIRHRFGWLANMTGLAVFGPGDLVVLGESWSHVGDGDQFRVELLPTLPEAVVRRGGRELFFGSGGAILRPE